MIELLLKLPAKDQIDLTVLWQDGEGEWHKARVLLEGLSAGLGVTTTQHTKETV